MKKTILPLCVSLFALCSVQAATYKFDFNDQAGSAGSSWNVYDQHTDLTGTIDDTTGSNAAGISISASGDILTSTGNGLYNDNGPTWVETDAGVDGDDAADDFFWTGNDDANETSFTISFTGLNPGDTVSVDLFASRQSALVLTAFYDYSLDGSVYNGFTVLESNGIAATTDGWNGVTTQAQQFNLDENGGYEDGRYMNASNLTVGASGTLDVRLTSPVGSNYAGINAMQLTVIPEPSSMCMMILGFVGFCFIRFKK